MSDKMAKRSKYNYHKKQISKKKKSFKSSTSCSTSNSSVLKKGNLFLDLDMNLPNNQVEKAFSTPSVVSSQNYSECSSTYQKEISLNHLNSITFLQKKREKSPSLTAEEFMIQQFPMITNENSMFYQDKNSNKNKPRAKITQNFLNKNFEGFKIDKKCYPKCLWKPKISETELDNIIEKIYKNWPYELCAPKMEIILNYIMSNDFNQEKIDKEIDNLILYTYKISLNVNEKVFNVRNKISKYNLRASSYDSYYYIY